MVISLERGEDLHMAQLMPLPLTVSCFSKIQIDLPFWYRLTWVVTEKGLLNGCCCCILLFYPRDAMLATGTTVAMALCLCLSQVGVLKKLLDESSWFLAWGLLSTCPTLCFKEIQISSKIRDFSPERYSKLAAYRSSKRVVNLAREKWTLRA